MWGLVELIWSDLELNVIFDEIKRFFLQFSS